MPPPTCPGAHTWPPQPRAFLQGPAVGGQSSKPGAKYGALHSARHSPLQGRRRDRCSTTGAKHEWGKFNAHQVFMGFEDIDSVGNGLLLFKPLEWAFDRSKLCFVYDSRFDIFNMHILDPAICEMPLLHV